MIAFALAQEGNVGGMESLVDADGNVVRDAAQGAFPLLVKNALPTGIRGVVVAGLLSALMSSLAGVFNACSTLFTMDCYSKLHPTASQSQLVWTGRLATGAMVLMGIAWVPVIANSDGLYGYLQGVQSYLAPPIFVVFFGGIFFKRLNAAGCLAALVVGFALGVWKLSIDTPVELEWEGYMDGYPVGSLNHIINNMYFQYFSLVIFLVCSAVMTGVSLITSPPDYDRISGLTFGAITDEDRQRTRASWSNLDVAASVLVMALIITAYIYFQG